MLKVAKKTQSMEREALKAALLKIGFVECSEAGEETVYLIDQPTRAREFVAIGLEDSQVTTFANVISILGGISFRIGRRDPDTAVAYQALTQSLMAESIAYSEMVGLKAAGNE